MKSKGISRSVDVDDKDYIDLFLDNGYDEEIADEDFNAGIRGWWSNEWVPDADIVERDR